MPIKAAFAMRTWVDDRLNDHATLSSRQFLSNQDAASRLAQLEHWAGAHDSIHLDQCFNLNPATNVMNPKAHGLMRSGLATRPSLGHAGDKYEMGLEAVEQIELATTALVCELFSAKFAECRVASGAMANLYGFMATCRPGDTIIVPPASVGGHVTHHDAGAAGLYGLRIIEAPVNSDDYSVDIAALAVLIDKERPKLITIGGSLNLKPHPVQAIADLAHSVGAKLLFDAAHQCGLIAGGVWPNPLDQGADLMSMSTYKSLGGPAAGLIVTNDPALAQRLDAIAFPGLTANFDAANTAALAVCLLDWQAYGTAYATAMVDTAQALASALQSHGVPLFNGGTQSHQFAVPAAAYGGGQTASKHLRRAGLLVCGIGLPCDPVAGDLNGIRFGTPEIVRWGMGPEHMARLGAVIAKALDSDAPQQFAAQVAQWRQEFRTMRFVV